MNQRLRINWMLLVVEFLRTILWKVDSLQKSLIKEGGDGGMKKVMGDFFEVDKQLREARDETF